jgi:hypothetical protein
MLRQSTKSGEAPKPLPALAGIACHPFSPSLPRQARRRGQEDNTNKSTQKTQTTALFKETSGRRFGSLSDRQSKNAKLENTKKPQIWLARSREVPPTTSRKLLHHDPKEILGRRRHLPSTVRHWPCRRERLRFGPTLSGALSVTVAEEREEKDRNEPRVRVLRA